MRLWLNVLEARASGARRGDRATRLRSDLGIWAPPAWCGKSAGGCDGGAVAGPEPANAAGVPASSRAPRLQNSVAARVKRGDTLASWAGNDATMLGHPASAHQ